MQKLANRGFTRQHLIRERLCDQHLGKEKKEEGRLGREAAGVGAVAAEPQRTPWHILNWPALQLS